MRKLNPRQLHIRPPDTSGPRCAINLVQRPMMRIPSAWRALWYLIFLAVAVLCTVLYTLNWPREDALKVFRPGMGAGVWEWGKGGAGKDGNDNEEEKLLEGVHPIKHLMGVAEEQFKTMIADEATTLHGAAATYREKRGRHAPPGFDAWYQYAVEQGTVVIEGFWDQIYDDLTPFWSIEPVLLRKQAHVFSPKISIRDGKVEVRTKDIYSKLDVWADMLKTLTSHPHVYLPDMDIPFNVNDEPAILVPWETVDTAISMTRALLLDPTEVIAEYSSLDGIVDLTANFTFDPEWLGSRLTHPASQLGPRPLWSLVRPACPPQSSARAGHVFNDIWDPAGDTSNEHLASALLPLKLREGTVEGYTTNWTRTSDACDWPNGQGLHSAFVSPAKMSVSKKLFPLFSDTKFSMSSEILVPGAAEWNATYSLSQSLIVPWAEKSDMLFWRGPATQGREQVRYWQRLQRHRLVSMLNATHVEIAEASIHSGNESTVGVGYAKTFRLLPANEYHLKVQTGGQLAEWVNGWADVAFTDLKCDTDADSGVCPYLDEYFSISEPTAPKEEAKYKYTIIVDGDIGDDNGDLVRSMNSGKVTLRSSIYRKWYDSRIVPWLHFIPMDNTFIELYGIMEYFLGTGVSDEAKIFSHAVGEVQHHEHHFQMPGEEVEEEIEAPHISDDSHTKRKKREGDGHDAAAERIASVGKEWAEKVLRREDMLVYMYRLLLEYARVVDDRRERLGWIGDLVED